jgi:hypothetical protein
MSSLLHTVMMALALCHPTNTPDPTRCVEDESMVRYDEDTVVCLHVEGDGWRVLQYPPALPAEPVTPR